MIEKSIAIISGDLAGSFSGTGQSNSVNLHNRYNLTLWGGAKCDFPHRVVERRETELVTSVRCFTDDFEAWIAHLRMPVTHRRAIRTTILLEHLFLEERRRLKIIPNPLGEKPVLKLMFGAMIRGTERWRVVKVTEFERRQLAVVRQDLDREYEARTGLKAKPSSEDSETKVSALHRLDPVSSEIRVGC